MRRSLPILITLLIAATVLTVTVVRTHAAEQATFPGVRHALEDAVSGERQAIARYEAFEKKATEEGYLGVASLFRAQVIAEKAHLARFTSVLEKRGITVPGGTASAPLVGTTRDNLRAAAAAEIKERDDTYRSAIDAAKMAGDTEIAKVFDQTRDAETEHANLSNTVANRLDKYREAKTFFVCQICGYVTDLDLGMCPSCRGAKVVEVQ
ncbi:MAG TPA: rubrerythrin family protein [Thermoanaerobaculia bacterium]|nr:rubrerythrin family protein [Thermoanaerobaculia bacterium]